MTHTGRDIIVVGASAGGVPALRQLVCSLPMDLPAVVFIVLHIWPEGRSLLPVILGRETRLPVLAAVDGDAFSHGKIYVAPPDYHLFVERDRMLVIRGPRENRARPAINPLFRSAALAYRERVVGAILTGTLDDGAAGLWAVKRCGGVAVVQSDAEFPDMPKAAQEAVEVDFDVPLAEIGPLLVRLSREPVERVEPEAAPPMLQYEDDTAKMKTSQIDLDKWGQRSVYSCPECNGALWELHEGGLQYRCHVGHAFSAEILYAAQQGNIEQSLWTAVRALKESADLEERLAKRADEGGLGAAATAYRRNAADKLAQVMHLQQFLSALKTTG